MNWWSKLALSQFESLCALTWVCLRNLRVVSYCFTVYLQYCFCVKQSETSYEQITDNLKS